MPAFELVLFCCSSSRGIHRSDWQFVLHKSNWKRVNHGGHTV